MRLVVVNDKMQKGYQYDCPADVGILPDNFNPTATPKDMLTMGVFGGKYMTDCRDEFPADWFENAKLDSKKYNPNLNFFKVKASQNLKEWKDSGWLHEQDPRGWFQWYCRFYMGRRTDDDARQIMRWKKIKRHLTYITNRFEMDEWTKNTGSPVRRQALLHWGIRVDGTYTAQHLLESLSK
jgi:hypothetical protein